MADVTKWAFLARDYAAERETTAAPRSDAAGEHPLAPRAGAPSVRRSSRRAAPQKASAPAAAAAPPEAPDDPLSGALAAVGPQRG